MKTQTHDKQALLGRRAAHVGGYGTITIPAARDHDELPDCCGEVKVHRKRGSGSGSRSGVAVLFRCASGGDRVLMVAGSVFAAVHGVSFPILAMVFGSMTNTFLNHTEYRTEHFTAEQESNATTQIQLDDSAVLPALLPREVPAEPAGLTAFMAQFSFYYLAIGATVLIAASMQVLFWELACERQVHRLRRLFFAQVLRQDIAWFEQKGGGDMATKISDDLERVREGTGSKLSMVVQYVATFLSGVSVGLVASWRLTLAVLAAGPLLIGATATLARVVTVTAREEQLRYSAAGSVASQALSAIRTVAAFGGQEREVDRYRRGLEEGLGMAMKKYVSMSFSQAAVYFFMYSTYGLAFWYGAGLIGDGLASPGSVFTVLFSVLAGALSIGNSLPFIQAVSTALGAAASVCAVVERVPDIDPYEPHGLCPTTVQGRIQFKGVKFHYPTRPGVKVLRDFQLDVEPGSTVALVGSSGAGKSTVVRLLLRFHDANQGSVLVDGQDVCSLNLPWLRSQIGLVSQDPVLFATTILENIRLGRQDVTVDEVLEAAKTANAHEFISALPEGYATVLGDGGTQLSGGQRQRVAIARAVVRRPAILLLDEATSALDSEGEAVVQAALERAARGRTTLVIAHRLSTIRHVDLIHAMQDGQVVESGTHEQLMERGGLYHQLVMAQVSGCGQGGLDENKEDSESDSSTCSAGTDEEEGKPSGRRCSDQPWRQPRGSYGVEEEDIGKVELPEVRLCRLFRIGAPELHWLLLGLLGCALTGSTTPVFAFFYGEVFHTFTLSGEDLRSSATFWALMFLVLAVVAAVSWWIQIVALTVASERLLLRVRVLAFRNVIHQAVGWFDKDCCSPGKLAARLARDAPSLKAAAGWRVGQVVSAFFTIFEAMLIAFVYGWKLALVLVIAVPFIVTAYYQQSMVVRRHQRRDAELMASAVRVASESVANIEMVQALGREHHFLDLYSRFLQEPFREATRHAFVYAAVFAVTQALVYAMYAAAFRLGAYLIEIGDMTSIDVYRVFFALAFCAPQVGITSAYLQDFHKAKLAAGLMLQLIDRKPDIDYSEATGFRPVVRGKLALQQVCFRYPERPAVMVLRGLSLEVEPGKTLALVGASGCGKSTVLALIQRFYEPTAGAVLIDDIDIRTVNLSYLRSHIGLVTQDPVLFDCSIRDNIAYGLRGATEWDQDPDDCMADIIEAARTANIHDFIVKLPQGYDTLVGPRGAQLSGGQRQRVAIARALVAKPRVLLLDEATSALDTESEKVVQEALERARLGRTCILVAHRLSTVRSADCIAVIHKGRVVEQGSHSQLTALRGRYHRLVSGQRL